MKLNLVVARPLRSPPRVTGQNSTQKIADISSAFSCPMKVLLDDCTFHIQTYLPRTHSPIRTAWKALANVVRDV